MTQLSTPELIDLCIERVRTDYEQFPNAYEHLASVIADHTYARFLRSLPPGERCKMEAARYIRRQELRDAGLKAQGREPGTGKVA